jgi:hypothetical protein
MASFEVPEQHREFAERVAASRAQDPLPTFRSLSCETGVPFDDLVHFALVRWASAGSEALISAEPRAFADLLDARRREDWAAVAGIVDWLASGDAPPDGDGDRAAR